MTCIERARVVLTGQSSDANESFERAAATRLASGMLGVLLLFGAACGEQSSEPTGGASGASPMVSGAGGVAFMSGGLAAEGGMATNSGGGGIGGQASSTPAGSGGSAGMTGGGNSGAGGSSVGAAGNASDPAADRAAFAALDGFQILDPCDLTGYAVQPDPGAVCPQKDAVKNQHITVQLGGMAGVTYGVTLRVRGVVERYWYDGGSLDPMSKVFYTGGVPTVGGFASACKNQASSLPFVLPAELTPSDGCFNGFNVFAMSVSMPHEHFFLNYTTDKDGDRPPHAVYSQDYSVSVEMQGQATLDFFVIGSDEHECYNHDQVIDGVQLSSSPYIGEFLQLNVVNVTRKAPPSGP